MKTKKRTESAITTTEPRKSVVIAQDNIIKMIKDQIVNPGILDTDLLLLPDSWVCLFLFN